MAKKNVVIFDGEDKFINPKKAVYSKSKGQSKKAESFKSVRADIEEEAVSTDQAGSASQEAVSENLSEPSANISPVERTAVNAIPSITAPAIDIPSPATIAADIRATVLPNIQTSTVTKETVMAPTPPLPSFSASSPVSGLGLSFGQNATTKSCPAGMRDYFGTCVPITNQYAVCQQGYMKEYEGGPCVPIPASGAIGGCGAGYEYKMGMRSGSLTPEMGCYPIGSTQDINTGSSTGAILGGGAGTNIGGGGTTQGGGGSYADTKVTDGAQPSAGLTCNDNQIFDPKTGSCIPKYTTAPVPCPAGFTLNKATGTCIESLNPQDYKCPPIDLPTPPKCKKYAVVGKDKFGCDRFELVDDAANCPDVIQEKPIVCKDGLIYSLELKKCVNPIDETKRQPTTKPEGTCPEGFYFNIDQQKCVSKCPEGMTYDVVNKICVSGKKEGEIYCGKNLIWDPKSEKCVFSGTVTPDKTTSQTTTTTTKAPVKDFGIIPVGDASTGGGGGGGGSEEELAAAAAKKNYFWWYVGGAVLTYYLYKKYYKKK